MNVMWLVLAAVLAIVITPLVGGVLKGFDRRLTARMQGRIGPPLMQPFYDFIKLLNKKSIASGKALMVFTYAYLILMVAAVVLFALGQDLLVTLFVFFFGGLCLPLGALSVKSPYSQIGGNRELLQFLAFEPILLLAAIPIALKTGAFSIASVFSYGQPLLPSLWLTFLGLLLALVIVMRKSPFDISSSEHAHQELVRGVFTEYSGPYLALLEVGHWYESVLGLAMVGLLWASGTYWWLSIIIGIGSWFLLLVLDNITARLKWSSMLKYAWGIGIPLVAFNILFINLGWM
jgi:ech hydrogenase subunit B